MPSGAEQTLQLDTQTLLANLAPETPKILERVVVQGVPLGQCIVPEDRPLFQPSPPRIVFQGFKPFATHEVSLFMRNQDKVGRRVKALPSSSPFFNVKAKSNTADKIASGLEVEFVVSFRPEENIDYSMDLVFVTDREKFVVPVTAIGARGALDFPDELDFTACPVKCLTTKSFNVRNVGRKMAEFSIKATPPFQVEPLRGKLDVGCAMQVSVSFAPKTLGDYRGEMTVGYATGESVLVKLSGCAEDANIVLEKTSVKLPSTHITRMGRVFQYRGRYGDGGGDYVILERRKGKMAKTVVDWDTVSVDSRSGIADQEMQLRSKLKELTAKTVVDTEDLAEFRNDLFLLDPPRGEIWPHSQCDVMIIYHPTYAEINEVTAYLDISGREQRLPLKLYGEGVGPDVRVVPDVINLGKVFHTQRNEFNVTLENRSSIEAYYEIIPTNPASPWMKHFSFAQDGGELNGEEYVDIPITFCADVPGSFEEDFLVKYKGTSYTSGIKIKGKVVGPTFTFSESMIDFGVVSYGFLCSKSVTITNTSPIPMVFKLRVPEDGKMSQKEFGLVPSHGVIEGGSSFEVMIDFISTNVKKYNCTLAMDIDGVGVALGSVAIKAECVMPKVSLNTTLIDFGDCFLRHQTEHTLEITNESELPSKYEFLPQQDGLNNAVFSVDRPSGIIPPFSEQIVCVGLSVIKSGRVSVSLQMRTAGSDETLTSVSLNARGIGPKVSVTESSVDFGVIPVLVQHNKTVSIVNDSDIVARYSCSLRGTNTQKKGGDQPSGAFVVSPTSGDIAPRTRNDLDIVCNLDDQSKFAEELVINIQEGDKIIVPVTAKGTGATLMIEPAVDEYDFGCLSVKSDNAKTFKVINKGRRTISMIWTLENSKKKRDPDLPEVFKISPERTILAGGQTAVITVTASSVAPLVYAEKVSCMASMGHVTPVLVCCINLKAEFVLPLLEFLPNSLSYSWTYGIDRDPLGVMNRTMMIKNVSRVPLDISLKCPSQFSISQPGGERQRGNSMKLLMGAGDQIVAEVFFDPTAQKSNESFNINGKIVATLNQVNKKVNVSVAAVAEYPRVDISVKSVEFGAVLIDTSKTIPVVVKNTSIMPITYSWELEADGDQVASTDITTACSIQPFSGSLSPGECLTHNFSYTSSRAVSSLKCEAVCVVTGGSEYHLPLTAEMASSKFMIDKNEISFGPIDFLSAAERDFTVHNPSKLPLEYRIDVLKSSCPHTDISVNPIVGTVAASSSARISIRMTPGYPDEVIGMLNVICGFHEPVQIRLTATGIFPLVMTSLPNYEILKNDIMSAHNLLPWNDDGITRAPTAQSLRASTRGGSDVTGVRTKFFSSNIVPSLVPPDTLSWPSVNHTLSVLMESGDSRLKELPVVDQKKRAMSLGIEASRWMLCRQIDAGVNAKSKCKYDGDHIDAVPSGCMVVAHYVYDFGPVTLGQVKKKTFGLLNVTGKMLSFEMPRAALSNSVYGISPEKYKNMTALPSAKPVDICVTLTTKSKTAPSLGMHVRHVPFLLSSSCCMLLTLKANVTIPDLGVEPDSLAFGTINVGQCRILQTTLYNPSDVVCDWSVIPPKDDKRKGFRIYPDKGLLAPNSSVVLNVAYVPTEGGKTVWNVQFKIPISKKQVELQLVASANDASLKLSVDKVVLPACQPNQSHLSSQFSIRNESNVPLELYSLDNDRLHHLENAIMLKMSGYDSMTKDALAPVRTPGNGLPNWMIDVATNAFGPQAVADLDKFVTGVSVNAVHPVTAIQLSNANAGALLEPPVALRAPSMMQLPQTFVVDRDPSPVILVLGPPKSGKSSVARGLADRMQCVSTNLDAILDWCDGNSVLADSLARLAATPKHTSEDVRAVLCACLYAFVRDVQSERGVVIDGLDCRISSNLVLNAECVLVSCCQHMPPVLQGSYFTPRVVRDDDVSVVPSMPGLPHLVMPQSYSPPMTHYSTKNVYVVRMEMTKELYMTRVLPPKAPGASTSLIAPQPSQSGDIPAHLQTPSHLIPYETMSEDDFNALDPTTADSIERELRQLRLARKEYKKQLKKQSVVPPIVDVASTKSDPKHHGSTKNSARNVSSSDKRRVDDEAKDKEALDKPTTPNANKTAKSNKPKPKDDNVTSSVVSVATVPVIDPAESNYNAYMSVCEELMKLFNCDAGQTGVSLNVPVTDPKRRPKTTEKKQRPETSPGPVIKEKCQVVTIKTDSTDDYVSDALQRLSLPDIGPKTSAVFDRSVVHYPGPLPMSSPEDPTSSLMSLMSSPVVISDEGFSLVTSGSTNIEHGSPRVGSPDLAVKKARKIPKTPDKKPVDKDKAVVMTTTTTTPTITDNVEQHLNTSKYRWFIQPGESVSITVLFRSSKPGDYKQLFSFGVVGQSSKIVVPCQASCSMPTIDSDPLHIISSKVQAKTDGQIVRRKYVISSGVYEFGPVFVAGIATKKPVVSSGATAQLSSTPSTSNLNTTAAKQRPKKQAGTDKLAPANAPLGSSAESTASTTNVKPLGSVTGTPRSTSTSNLKSLNVKDFSSKTRPGTAAPVGLTSNWTLTNIGVFPCEISCKFSDSKDSTFSVSPSDSVIAPGKTQEIIVTAKPSNIGIFENNLVVFIKDNPTPVSIKMSCIGEKPTLKLSTNVFNFDRIRTGLSNTMSLTITNVSMLKSMFRFVDQDSSELVLTPSEFSLDPTQSCEVKCTFCSTNPVVLKKSLEMCVFDISSDGIQQISHVEQILVNAEAYDVVMDLSLPKDNHFNFGAIRVKEETSLTCSLKCKSKYQVKFAFVILKESLSKFITIEPAKGLLSSGDKAPQVITLTFAPQAEITVKEAADVIKCSIIDPQNDAVVDVIKVKVSCRAVYSQYNVAPVQNVAFGPTLAGNTRSRTLEIVNSGEFEFNYQLYNADDVNRNPRPESRAEKPKTPKSGVREAPKPASSKTSNPKVAGSDVLHLGNFTVSPSNGVVPAGGNMVINVDFLAKGSVTCDARLGIDVSDAPPEGHASKMIKVIELFGESCTPGIDTASFSSIFEEQCVVRRIDGPNVVGYATDDHLFSFGSVIVGLESVQRFKLYNPNKIPCDVSLSITAKGQLTIHASKTDTAPVKKRAASSAVDGDATPQPASNPFIVSPTSLSIPPREYRYVSVTFSPTSLQTFTSVFEAFASAESKSLMFDLRGDGTMPHLIITEPQSTPKGLILAFDRVITNRQRTNRVIVKNDGLLSVDAVFELVSSPYYSINCTGAKLAANETKQIDVVYHPLEQGKHSAILKVRISDNSFCSFSININGECYMQDYIAENFTKTGVVANHLAFGEVAVGSAANMTYNIVNSTLTPCQYSLPSTSDLSFVPSLGLLGPNETTTITATLKPSTSAVYDKPVICSFKKVASGYTAWNNGMNTVTYVCDELSPQPRKVTTAVQAPSCTLMDGSAVDISIPVSYRADKIVLELDTKDALFKKTFMYQSRSHISTIKNTSSIRCPVVVTLINPATGKPWDPNDENLDDDLPFTVEPKEFWVSAGGSERVSYKFAPMEAKNFEAIAEFKYPGGNIRMNLIGEGLRPLCHLDIQDSDYLTSGRRANKTPMDASAVRVFEVNACGVKVKHTSRFRAINPTNMTYEFSWTCMDEVPDASPFKCTTRKGLIVGGKQFEMVFTFAPTRMDIVESLYKFSIPEHHLDVCDGQAREPFVSLDKTLINFHELLVGRTVKSQLRIQNDEDIPYTFSFGVPSSEEYALGIEPIAGNVGPHSHQDLEVSMKPLIEGPINCNLLCNIPRKPSPLSVNIKAEGYAVQCDVYVPTGTTTRKLLSGKANAESNAIEFGGVLINEKITKTIVLANIGRYNFDFVFGLKCEDDSDSQYVTFDPVKGCVPFGQHIKVSMTYAPKSEKMLSKSVMTCKIADHLLYVIPLSGNGRKPMIHTSFTKYDFGVVPVYRAGGEPPKTVELVIKNNDTIDVSLDTGDYTPPEYLEGQVPPTLLKSQKSEKFVFTFIPPEARKYIISLPLKINGVFANDITIEGEAVLPKIGLVDPKQSHVTFGSVSAGKTSTFVLKLVNRAKIATSFSLNETVINKLRDSCFVTVSPPGPFTLPVRGSVDITFTMSPKMRVRPFSEKLSIKVAGTAYDITTVSGSCHGMELRCSENVVSFGQVVTNSCATRHVLISNIGDFPAKLIWDLVKLPTEFTITPSSGVVMPGDDITFACQCCPKTSLGELSVTNVMCNVDGGGAGPFKVSLFATAVQAEANSESLNFRVEVRQIQSKTISIKNPSGSECIVKPVISNKYFEGSDVLRIPANGTAQYTMSYHPLSMTSEGVAQSMAIIDVNDKKVIDKSLVSQTHDGTVFFPLPDGKGLLYTLSGVALPPKRDGEQSVMVDAKVQAPIAIPMKNVFDRPVRYVITTKTSDESVKLDCMSHIDVAALSEQNFRLVVLALKEGIFSATITLVDSDSVTKEYLTYLIHLKVGPTPVLKTIDMVSNIRQPCKGTIEIQNALNQSVTLTGTLVMKNKGESLTAKRPSPESECYDVYYPKTVTVSPKSTETVVIEYIPLVPREAVATLIYSSSELGKFLFDFKLKASASSAEPTLSLSTPLGIAMTKSFRFQHMYRGGPVEYACAIAGTDFHVDKSITVPPASDVSIDVIFDPSIVGPARSKLTVTHPMAGTYSCIIQAVALQPKPQGPLIVRNGATLKIPFKNVSKDPNPYSFAVDNNAFSVKPATETVAGKATTSVVVSFKTEGTATAASQLTITCMKTGTVWTYYLKGM